MWGLWLVAETHQQAAGQLADGRLQSHMKSGFFSWNNISECTTFTQQPTGWPQQYTTPSQGAQKAIPCARGHCPVNIEGCWWWCWGPGLVLSEVSQPWERGSPFVPVPEVWTLKDRGCDGDRGTENNIIPHSELLLCQGHRTLLGCYRHRTLHIVHGALNFI